MDKKTLTALKNSIEKWRKVASGEGYEWANRNCALCKAHEACAGCPVATSAGENRRRGCVGTPYFEWDEHQRVDHGKYIHTNKRKAVKGCKECARLARAEHDFLRALLPKPARKPKTPAGRGG